MKIKDIVDELSKYDENTEVFVNDLVKIIYKDDFRRVFIF